MDQLVDTKKGVATGFRVSPPDAQQRIRVVVADDHPFMRQGLRFFLEESGLIEVAAEASDGAEAVRLIEQHRPDVAVLDVNMPELNGLEVAEWATEHHAATRILILTAYDDVQHIQAALKSGVNGYLLKDAEPERIIEAVVALNRGESVFDPAVARNAASSDAVDSDTPLNEMALTGREREILVALATGQSDKVIGQKLGISSYTVGSHMTRLFRKLGVSSRTQAIAKAVMLGVIEAAPPS